jgi:hypothetical protein
MEMLQNVQNDFWGTRAGRFMRNEKNASPRRARRNLVFSSSEKSHSGSCLSLFSLGWKWSRNWIEEITNGKTDFDFVRDMDVRLACQIEAADGSGT